MKEIILIDSRRSGMVKERKIYLFHSVKMIISKVLEQAQMECSFMPQIHLLIPIKQI